MGKDGRRGGIEDSQREGGKKGKGQEVERDGER